MVCACVAQFLLSRGNRRWSAAFLRRLALSGSIVGAVAFFLLSRIQRYAVRQAFSTFTAEELSSIVPDEELLEQCKSLISRRRTGEGGHRPRSGSRSEESTVESELGDLFFWLQSTSSHCRATVVDLVNTFFRKMWQLTRRFGGRHTFALRLSLMMVAVMVMAVRTQRVNLRYLRLLRLLK